MKYEIVAEESVFESFLSWAYDGYILSPLKIKVSTNTPHACHTCGEPTQNYLRRGPKKGGVLFICDSCVVDESLQVQEEVNYHNDILEGVF